MKRFRPALRVIIVLFVSLLATPLAVQAQEGPVVLGGLEPDAGFLDTEIEVRIVGSGFELPEEIDLFIDDVVVMGLEIENDDTLRAALYIPPDAAPGTKEVILSYVLDATPFRAMLPGGFIVLPPRERPAAPLELFAVEPDSGLPDTEMEIRLLGSGFDSPGELSVNIEGVEIWDQGVEADQQLAVTIYIPPDAPPGPRWVDVERVEEDGTSDAAFLEQGFNIMPPDRPPVSTGGDRQISGGGQPGLWVGVIWPLATILLMVVSYALGRGMALHSKLSWTEKAKLQWRQEASTKLPPARQACEWACKATGGANLLNRWQVKRLELTPLQVKGKTPSRRVVDNKNGALDALNDLTNIADALRSPEAVRARLAGVVDAILAQILAWEQEGQSPASVRLDARLAGAVDATYGLYHCHQTRSGLSWGDKPLLKWNGKLSQPAGECLGVLRGPTAGEADFSARARREIEACLLDLLDSVRLWL